MLVMPVVDSGVMFWNVNFHGKCNSTTTAINKTRFFDESVFLEYLNRFDVIFRQK